MNKSDLKTGMRTREADGTWGIVLLGTDMGDLIVHEGVSYRELAQFDKDLKNHTYKPADIMKVYYGPGLSDFYDYGKRGQLAWSRDESHGYFCFDHSKKMIDVKGKLWSEDTIQEALKNHAK